MALKLSTVGTAQMPTPAAALSIFVGLVSTACQSFLFLSCSLLVQQLDCFAFALFALPGFLNALPVPSDAAVHVTFHTSLHAAFSFCRFSHSVFLLAYRSRRLAFLRWASTLFTSLWSLSSCFSAAVRAARLTVCWFVVSEK